MPARALQKTSDLIKTMNLGFCSGFPAETSMNGVEVLEISSLQYVFVGGIKWRFFFWDILISKAVCQMDEVEFNTL